MTIDEFKQLITGKGLHCDHVEHNPDTSDWASVEGGAVEFLIYKGIDPPCRLAIHRPFFERADEPAMEAEISATLANMAIEVSNGE